VADSVSEALSDARALGENGLQVAACLRGELIVEAAAGDTGGADARAVDESTLFPIFSVSKAITATALHIQADRGLVDYDAPVATYWPAYGSSGKGAITVRHVLSHRAGVPQMPADVTPETLVDWEWMTSRLAAVEPVVEPGTANTYLSMVFGWIVGEVVRRTDPQHRSFADFVRDEILDPLSIDSLFLGLPASEAYRVATLEFPEPPPAPQPGSLSDLAVPAAVQLLPEAFNRPDVQAGVVPAVGGIANARSVARFFAMLANRGELDGVRILSAERVDALLEPRPDVDVEDLTYGRRMPVGVGGLWIEMPDVPTDAAVLGHTGAGGTVAWAELDSGLSVAICHNRMFAAPPDPPFRSLVQAIRQLVTAEAVAH
jgi:CubicO group peptidase (beta-lactamase class C family)